MDRVPARLRSWWATLADWERRHATVLALIGLGYVVHYLVFCIPQPFFIEDSAISFAFSKHLVEGEGLVAYPGGERVEGYSNALWTFLVALFYGLGVPVWTSSKIMGAVFGVATLPLIYGLVLRALPERRGPGQAPLHADVALLAPALLAANTQFVVWNASGLENSLFCLLLAAGMWRLVAEVSDQDPDRPGVRDRRPLSAVLFFLLTMTRPEGAMYACIALLVRTVAAAQARRPLALLAWVLALLVPFAAYNGWRYWYFGWPLPNTYYAKVDDQNVFRPFAWDVRGWKYAREWFGNHGTVYALPLLVVGLTGLARWRRFVAVALLAAVGVVLLWDGREGLPSIPTWWRPVREHWDQVRIYTLLGASVLAGLVTLTRPGWRARGLMWATCASGVFFVVYSGGDWMKAHRWFNLVGLTLLPLFAIGAGELLLHVFGPTGRIQVPDPALSGITGKRAAWRRLVRRGAWIPLRPLLLLLLLGGWVSVEVYWSRDFALNPETSVRDIQRRVDFMRYVQRRLDIDDVTLLDVDMGAHLYSSGWEIVDIAGLVDVPIAHHRGYDKPFIREYLFTERRPDFAHVHSNWARTSKIPQHPEWKAQYLEVPGYPIGNRKLHVGNHIRKDHLVIDQRLEPERVPDVARSIDFEEGVRLRDWAVPAPVVAAGGLLFLDTTWQASKRDSGLRVFVVLDDGEGHRATAAVAPGFDWYTADSWRTRELVRGPFRVPVPSDLPAGTYQVGLLVVDEATGRSLAVTKMGAEARGTATAATGAAAPTTADDNAATASLGEPDDDDPAEPVDDELTPGDEPVEPRSGPERDDDDADGDDGDGGDDGATASGARTRGKRAQDAVAALPPLVRGDARFAPGEVWLDVQVQVGTVADAQAAAALRLTEAKAVAAAGDCEGAWAPFKDATRHVLRNEGWREREEPAVRRAIAACLVARADAANQRSDVDAYTAALVAARKWDHRLDGLSRRAAPLARSFDAQGDQDAAAEDWEAAYRHYSLALALDPSLSATRVRAEQARDQRLQIGEAAPVKASAPATRALPKTTSKKATKRAAPPTPAP